MWHLLRHCTGRFRQTACHYSTKPLSAEEIFKRKLLQQEKEKAKMAPEWVKREQTLRKRYGQWNPTHKLSRQQMNDIRELKRRAPHIKTIQMADFFHVNPESIRRILKSKWVPKDDELERLEKRADLRKQLSIERKRAEKLEAKSSAPKATASAPSGYSRSSPRPKTSGHVQKHAKQKDPSRRKKMPYTEGIGDFIE